MGGRGSSSGSKTASAPKISIQQAVVAPKPVANPQYVESGEFKKFMSMTDDKKADVISALTKQEVPVFLADNDFQKLTYAIGANDKPQLVTDKALDSMKGTELFRTVNNVRDTKNGISYDATTIASQVQKGSVTRVSDTGGSYYGRGIYFADSYGSSIGYGNVSGNISKTAVVRAKISPTAKIISHSQASSAVSKEIASGSKFGKALAKCDSASRVSIYAYSKGYSAIKSSDYYNILSRKALAISTDVKAKSYKW